MQTRIFARPCGVVASRCGADLATIDKRCQASARRPARLAGAVSAWIPSTWKGGFRGRSHWQGQQSRGKPKKDRHAASSSDAFGCDAQVPVMTQTQSYAMPQQQQPMYTMPQQYTTMTQPMYPGVQQQQPYYPGAGTYYPGQTPYDASTQAITNNE
jgi:hypothetical protein